MGQRKGHGKMDKWMSEYQRRVAAERLARQAPDVQCTAKEIREALKSIEQYMLWSLDPSEKDGGSYYCTNLIDHAHSLVDLGHAWRAVLAANPPTKEPDGEQEEDDDAA